METTKPKRGPRGPYNKTKTPEPTKLEKHSREIKKQLRDIAKDLWLNNWIVIGGLIASGLQLVIAFTYSAWWTIFPALFKAVFIESCVWALNKAIGWHKVLKLRGGLVFLWGVLVVVMFISTRANLQYEYEKKLQQHFPNDQTILVNSATVDKYLGRDEILDAWLRGGLIPLLVLAMIFARRILTVSSVNYGTEENQKTTAAIRQKQYRIRKQAEKNQLGGL